MGAGRFKPLEHGFKKLFFGIFKHSLQRRRDDFTPLDGSRVAKVLFLRPEKIGDMVISLPVFDGLRQQFPHIRIAILASPRNVALIEDDPRFYEIYLYRKSLLRDLRTMRAIRREKFDCVVDMICNDSVTALFMSQLTAPGKPRIGVGKNRYRDYYDFNYDHRRGNTGHIIENTLKLLEAFGIDSGSVSGYAAPYLTPADVRLADKVMATITDGSETGTSVGYNLSAGARSRIWAEEKSVQLVQRILGERDDVRLMLFVVPADRARAERVRQQCADRVHIIPDGLNLRQVSALIANLDLLISPDTSLVHIARAMKVPVVGLYSRYLKNFLLWRPYGQDVGAVVSNNDDNIFDITVDDVFVAYSRLTSSMLPVRR